jgi:glycosyltransferase involved in cell wall biosynthesis
VKTYQIFIRTWQRVERHLTNESELFLYPNHDAGVVNMRILIVLTYYEPYVSGLTIYAVRLARALVERGHSVRVLTSQYVRKLPSYEKLDGVEVYRVPVVTYFNKAAIMPGFPFKAWSLIHWAEVVNLHLPQADGAYIAFLSWLQRRPVVTTYQCDLKLPRTFINGVINTVARFAHDICGHISRSIIALSQDYANNSAFLRDYIEKVQPVNAPVVLCPITLQDQEDFRKKFGVKSGEKIIGMVARLAAEKGVEYLVDALPEVRKKYPEARVFYAGPYLNVLGEEAYYQKLLPKIKQLGQSWIFLGVLSNTELTAFYQECSVTVLPSLNSTDAFGMVQIESMICGTPVVATDLPGLRVPVQLTGMGKIVPARDSNSLAKALVEILDDGNRYRDRGAEVASLFSPQAAAARYDEIFRNNSKGNTA